MASASGASGSSGSSGGGGGGSAPSFVRKSVPGTTGKAKARPKFPDIPGCFPSLSALQLMTSSGAGVQMDQALGCGGGIPVGAVVLVVEEKARDAKGGVLPKYSKVLLKYFLAEGVFHNQDVLFGSTEKDGKNFLRNLPEVTSTKDNIPGDAAGSAAAAAGPSSASAHKMQIAWRYQNQNSPSSFAEATQTAKHTFNMQKTIDPALLAEIRKKVWAPERRKVPSTSSEEEALAEAMANEAEPYRSLFAEIESEFFACPDYNFSTAKNLLRIGIENAGSVLFGGGPDGKALSRFLMALRSLLRSYLGVCVISVEEEDFTEAGMVRLIECTDLVVGLKPFDAEGSGGFADKHGFLEVRKGCSFNSLDHLRGRGRFVFKSLKGKMLVEKMHLPPELGEAPAAEAAGGRAGAGKEAKKPTKKDLDF